MKQPFLIVCFWTLLWTSFWATFCSSELLCLYSSFDHVKCRNLSHTDNDLQLNTIQLESADRRSVERLDLSGCRIRRMAREAFDRFSEIKNLDLSKNLISTLKVDVFTNLSSLVSLDLSENYLAAINSEVFKPLKSLRRLDLSSNALALYDSEVEFLKGSSVKILDVSHNVLVDVEKVLALTNLKSLTVWNCEIKLSGSSSPNFGGTVMKLSHSTGLVLGNDSLSRMENLINLDLSHNGLKVIPPKLFSHNKQLKWLDLSHNAIENLTDSTFQNNTQLLYLSLSNNKLEIGSNALFNATTKLLHLDLSGNNITKLGMLLFKNLPDLAVLNLTDNKLKALHSSLFVKNVKLNVLNLDANELRSFDKLQFSSNSDLIALTASQNEIIDFRHSLVFNLQRLSVLNLDRNNLTRVDPELTNLPTLSDLHLSCNQISVLDNEFFETYESNFVAVRLHGNPLKCACVNNQISYRRRVNHVAENFSDGRSISCIDTEEDGLAMDCTDNRLDPVIYANWSATFDEMTPICRRGAR